MKLYYNRNAKDPIYYVQEGFRNGKKTSTRNVEKIGRHSDLLKITDDPLEYAKQRVAELNEQKNAGKMKLEVDIDLTEKVPASNDIVSHSETRNVGYLFLQAIYNDLDILSFLKKITSKLNIQFDIDDVNRFLTFDRILNLRSKLATHEHLDTYFEEPQFEYQHILRTLDILEEHFCEYVEHLYNSSCKILKRNTSICYFDCTNFYFEIEQNDEDYIDPVTNEPVKGLRKYGVSKEHRPNPLVEVGLFVDADGIPLSMCIAPGSANEQTLAVPAEMQLVRTLKGKKFIYCADAGLGSINIRRFNDLGGRAFVVAQSIKKLPEKIQQIVFNDRDYRLLSSKLPVTITSMKTFDHTNPDNLGLYKGLAYKVIPANCEVELDFYEYKEDKNGRIYRAKAKGMLVQNVIVTFSRQTFEYQRKIRANHLKRAQKRRKTKKPDEMKRGPNDVTRLIKRISKGNDGEEAKDDYGIDWDLIAKEEMYDGYYAIATNIIDAPENIIAINHQRYKIEDCFRVLRTNFESRPVYHHIPERIKAHFLICYTALLICRILKSKVNKYAATLKEGVNHFTISNIIETLINLNVNNEHDRYYSAAYRGSQMLNVLCSLYDLTLDRKYHLPKDLRKVIKKITRKNSYTTKI